MQPIFDQTPATSIGPKMYYGSGAANQAQEERFRVRLVTLLAILGGIAYLVSYYA